ncbi:MAG: methyltransferase domain-containing protein [Methylocella sp.]
MSILSLPNLRHYRSKLRLALDRFIDWRWGIVTIPEIDATANVGPQSESVGKFDDALQNQPVSYLLVFWFLGRIVFRHDDVFFDVGCGDGRALCYVARRRLLKVVGVELSPVFAEKAQANARNLKRRLSPIEVRCGDAVDMDYSAGTVFFFFNPFGAKTLKLVLDNIKQTIESNPRSIRIIYLNPVHSSVFRSSGWLKHAGGRKSRLIKLDMELWTSEGDSRNAVTEF